MILGRFLMRLLLVPLGGAIATLVATLFVVVAHWNRFSGMLSNQSGTGDNVFVALLFMGPAIIWILSLAAVAMMLPASVGVLIAEALAIRSWVFHVANGGLSAWVGWFALSGFRDPHEFYNEPLIVVGAGIAAGFAYWLVAGWSAGFWKPVFADEPPPVQPAARA